ncbi:unnamed protein product [Calicophoron daubneyi]|uniref:Nucleoprotein TPR n=1 Tax=Calicophoron daubneyi TaxID=300641 RepID=A0AAV2TA10_CALDB
MECLWKYAGLCEEECSSMDPELREKLSIAFDSISHDVEVLKQNNESLTAANDATMKQNTEQVDLLQKECESYKRKASEYEEMISRTDSRYREVRDDRDKVQTKLDDVLSVNGELSFAIRNLENEKDILSDQLKHKIDTVDQLNKELESLRSEIEDVRKMKIEMMFKAEEVSSREASIKAQETRWSEESATMQRHIDWLEERLRQTTDQLLTMRRDTTQKCRTLESDLDLRNTELENSKKKIQSLEESLEKLTKANEDYIRKLKQVADEQIRLEQLYGNELDAQKQLVSLYKEQLKEAENKNEELTVATSSMQSLLKDAYENVSRLESDKAALKLEFSEEQTRLQTNLEQVASELERNRQLLDKFRVDGLSEDELRQLNPAVAATLTALKRGHSLTQLYSDYIQVTEDRDQLRLDKQRLTEYVKQLVDDLKEKAPMLQSQQENYKRMQGEVKDLSARLQATSDKLAEAENRRDELQRRAGYFQRECSRLKQTSADLSRQVQTLLREVEIGRGTVIQEAEQLDETQSLDGSQLPDSSTINATDVSNLLDNIACSAGNVISEHLVTWRSLQELQSQNQRLLCVARDLAGQLEKREQEEAETMKKLSDLNSRLEVLSGELEVVRIAAREARTEAQIAGRQRDAYQALLKRYDVEVSKVDISESSIAMDETAVDSKDNPSPPWKPSDKSKGSGNPPSVSVERLQESLVSLETEFKRYRDDKTESDKVYSTTIDELRKEANKVRILNQKLAAQLDFTHEKLRTMETNVSGYKQEITVLREMNARYSTSAAASEAELCRLREDLTQASDKLIQVEVDARHATQQLEQARANEARWRQETEALRRQEQMHTQLMHQLQAIQGNLEQREATDRTSMERRINQLESQLTEAQSAFTEVSQTSKSTKETLEHELLLAREGKRSAEDEIEKLNSQLSSAQVELEALRSKTTDSESLTSSTQCTEGSKLIVAQAVKESMTRVSELQHEVEELRMRLEYSRQQADKMRELAEESERRLMELMDENKKLSDRTSIELDGMKQRCEFLEAQLDLEKKERQNLVNENIRTTEEAHQMNADLRKELTNLQGELEMTKSRCQSALELEAGAKAQIESHERVALEAREKYERELSLHAEDVESLTEARAQAESAKAQLEDLRQKASEASAKAESAFSELNSQTSAWESERRKLTEQLAETDKQRDLLQDQIIKLTEQIVSLRKLMEKPDAFPMSASEQLSTSDAPTGVSDLKTSEDLLQLVSYLRRQKSIAEASCDASSAEVSRLLLRISSLESQKERLQSELDKERKASESTALASQKHSELMERVEQLNLVTESNRMLRHERETLRSNLSQMEEQVASLQLTVDPLREQNRDLNAHVESLTSEKHSLEDERNRWKERCNRLVETAQRMDPEQYRAACNERDELQRKLRRSDDEVQQLTTRIAELQNELNERNKVYASELAESESARQTAEAKLTEQSGQCTSLRHELDAKETSIVKLREIGRKYRQEAETLRRQVAVNRSGEVQIQTLNEKLTEVRADLVTLRADLANERSERTQLSSSLSEISQLIEEMKSDETLGQVFTQVSSQYLTSTDSESQIGDVLGRTLRSVFQNLVREVSDLRQQAETQHERLLRMQIVESQLTKSLRDCSELRTRVAELQSTATQIPASSSSMSVFSSATPAISTEAEAAESQVHRQSLSTQSAVIQPENNACNQTETTTISTVTPVQGSEGSNTPSLGCNNTISQPTQSVPAWILRATANVQPVHPTPAVTPPSSVTSTTTGSSKQMAEIRPITSNVATVMPTPALHAATSAVPQNDCVLPASSNSSPFGTCLGASSAESAIPATAVAATVVTGLQPPDHSSRPDQFPVVAARGAPSRRLNIVVQASSGDHGISATALSHTPLSWSFTPVPSSSLFALTGKRRLDETSDATSPQASISGEERTSSPEPSRTREVAGSLSSVVPPISQVTVPFTSSDAKRPRQAVAAGPMSSAVSQTGPSPIVLGRSPFGHTLSTAPPLHATASRLIAVQQESSSHTPWTPPSSSGTVAGVVIPITASTPDANRSQSTPPIVDQAPLNTQQVSHVSSVPSTSEEQRMAEHPVLPETVVVPIIGQSSKSEQHTAFEEPKTGGNSKSVSIIASDNMRSVVLDHESPVNTASLNQSSERADAGARDADEQAVICTRSPSQATGEQIPEDMERGTMHEEGVVEQERDVIDEFSMTEPTGSMCEVEESSNDVAGHEEVGEDDEMDDDVRGHQENEEEIETEGEESAEPGEPHESFEEPHAEAEESLADSCADEEVIELSSDSDNEEHDDTDEEKEDGEELVEADEGGQGRDEGEEEDAASDVGEEEEEEADEGDEDYYEGDAEENEDHHFESDQHDSLDAFTNQSEPEKDVEEEPNGASGMEGLTADHGDHPTSVSTSSETRLTDESHHGVQTSSLVASSDSADTENVGHHGLFSSVPQPIEHPKFTLFGSSITPASSSTGGLFSSFRPSTLSSSTEDKTVASAESTTASHTTLFRSCLLPTPNPSPFSQAPALRPSIFSPAIPTSSGGAPVRPVASSASSLRPKIQPIVWDSSNTVGSSTHPTSADQTTPRVGAARRKKWGSSTGVPRGRGGPYSAPGSSGPTKLDNFASGRGMHPRRG